MHLLEHWLGLDNPAGPLYLFWSGVGGYLIVLISGIIGFVKLWRQRQRHHEQLKRHIDYKFSKLTDEEAN